MNDPNENHSEITVIPTNTVSDARYVIVHQHYPIQ